MYTVTRTDYDGSVTIIGENIPDAVDATNYIDNDAMQFDEDGHPEDFMEWSDDMMVCVFAEERTYKIERKRYGRVRSTKTN